MRIEARHLDAILARARAGHPFEICGVLLGHADVAGVMVTEAVAVANQERTAPRVRYEIAPEDLLVAHTQKLHLLVVDPTLQDYQHVHPEPSSWKSGDWKFKLTPNRPGEYLVFADFTPAVTQRGLYAVAGFTVPGQVARVMRTTNTLWQGGGFNFELVVPQIFRAGQQTDLKFRVESSGTEKKPVPLAPISAPGVCSSMM